VLELIMKREDKSAFDYWREAAPDLVAYGIRMGWISPAPDTAKATRAKRLKTQRECMNALRNKNKPTTKGKQNGSN